MLVFNLFFFFFFFFFFWPSHGMRKFPGQRLNPHHSSDLSFCTDNVRSLSCWAARECPQFDFYSFHVAEEYFLSFRCLFFFFICLFLTHFIWKWIQIHESVANKYRGFLYSQLASPNAFQLTAALKFYLHSHTHLFKYYLWLHLHCGDSGSYDKDYTDDKA